MIPSAAEFNTRSEMSQCEMEKGNGKQNPALDIHVAVKLSGSRAPPPPPPNSPFRLPTAETIPLLPVYEPGSRSMSMDNGWDFSRWEFGAIALVQICIVMMVLICGFCLLEDYLHSAYH